MTGIVGSGLKRRLPCASAACLLAFALACAGPIGSAVAEQVGVAAAVNPDAFSSLAGSPQTQLSIGKSIFYNERINTTDNGLVQVLLVDGSTFTVGPSSDLVIDKFVYDPKTGTGQIAASFSKGVMRFVGGKISKNEDSVTIKTSAGALAVRGGMFYGWVDGRRGLFPFIYGVELKLSLSNGTIFRAFEQRYTIDTEKGVRPTTPQDIDFFMNAFGGKGQGVAGKSSGANRGPKDANTQQIIQDANAARIQNQLQQQKSAQTTTVGTGLNPGSGNNTGTGTDPGTVGGNPSPSDAPQMTPVGLGVGGTPPPMAAGLVSLPPPFADGVPPGNAGSAPSPALPETTPMGLGVGGTPPPMAAGLVSLPPPFADGVPPGNAGSAPALTLPETLPPLPEVAKADPPGPPAGITPGPPVGGPPVRTNESSIG